MKSFVEKISNNYGVPVATVELLLAQMEELSFRKGEFVVHAGQRNTLFYIVKSGVWRAFRMKEGTEYSVWFGTEGMAVFIIWSYVNNHVSELTIEVEADSAVYAISRQRLEEMCLSSSAIANMVRKIFEQHALEVENSILLFIDNANATQRYLKVLKAQPELFQHVSLKKIASYLLITPQSLSRIRAGLKNKK
ncbi:MAG: Crp/Fnr family transcriptional regulator [Bacteroidales bacterium]